MEDLIKALPGPSEDENFSELKDVILFRAETDSQQLALLGAAYTVADELLPEAVKRRWSAQTQSEESRSGPAESISPFTSTSTEYKDWRRHLQHSFDKLKDHFCRQYVLSFIYSREGKTRLHAGIYLNGKGEDLYWGSDPLPSLPFQVFKLFFSLYFKVYRCYALICSWFLLIAYYVVYLLSSRVFYLFY